jgi:hypothetical protein
MGLYRLITEKQQSVQISQPHEHVPTGLLARGELLRGELHLVEKPFAAFHSFAEELGIERAGVIIPSENGYSMVFSHGLDRDTVWHFDSESGFWHELAAVCAEWAAFADRELEQFDRFFSTPERAGLRKMHMKSFFFSNNKTGFLILLESELNLAKQEIDTGVVDIVLPSLIELVEDAERILPDIPPYSLINRRESVVESEITRALERNEDAVMIQLSLAPVFDVLDEGLTTVDQEILFAGVFNLIQNIPDLTLIPYAYKSHIMRVILFGHPEQFEGAVKKVLHSLFGSGRGDAVQIQQTGRSSDQEQLIGYLIRNI